jgi:hypothetical protein
LLLLASEANFKTFTASATAILTLNLLIQFIARASTPHVTISYQVFLIAAIAIVCIMISPEHSSVRAEPSTSNTQEVTVVDVSNAEESSKTDYEIMVDNSK